MDVLGVAGVVVKQSCARQVGRAFAALPVLECIDLRYEVSRVDKAPQDVVVNVAES